MKSWHQCSGSGGGRKVPVSVRGWQLLRNLYFLLQNTPEWGKVYPSWTWQSGILHSTEELNMKRSLFTPDWTAPAPSAVPSFRYHLAAALASFAFAILVHAGTAVFGI